MNSTKIRWILLTIIIITVILVPYILFGVSIENWTNHFLQYSPTKFMVSIVIGTLLSVDILAPIPSSLVSTAGGYFLGFIAGMLISLTGMTISCFIGYWIGAKFGRHAAFRLVKQKEISKFEKLQKKYGDWIIIISRSIPLLAETSVIFAGIGRMQISRFIIMIILSNLGISIVYAFVGAYSAGINSFLLAFAGAISFPGILLLILRYKMKSLDDNT